MRRRSKMLTTSYHAQQSDALAYARTAHVKMAHVLESSDSDEIKLARIAAILRTVAQ